MFRYKEKDDDDLSDVMRDILHAHEVKTNNKMAYLLIVLTAISFILMLCLRFSLIAYDNSSSHIYYQTINITVMTATVIFTLYKEGDHRLCKYLIIICLLSISFNLNSHYIYFSVIFILPLLVASAYYNKRLTLIVSVLIVVLSFITVFTSVWNGIIDYNLVLLENQYGTIYVAMTQKEIIEVTINGSYLPFLFIFLISAAMAYLTTVRGLNMMRQNAVAETDRSQIGRELSIASEIQKGMLPADSFDNDCFRICASMIPAKDVGGDYYDYFMPDDKHIALIIADVSGKGIPASLFMASAKTMMHSYAMAGNSPSDVFDYVNRSLCESNPEKMFITAWMGLIDLETGRMTYTNAGHNPPYILRTDGSVSVIKSSPNFILGRKKKIRYKDYHLNIALGEKLFLYTDGVTEAMDLKKELFSSDRLVTALSDTSSKNPKEISDIVRKSVGSFTGEAEQSDDSTIIVFEYTSMFISKEEPGETFILNRSTYPDIISYISSSLRAKGCIEKTVTDFEICSSEILSNIDMYAYSGRGDGEVNISVNVGDNRIKVIFTDYGPEYNPLNHTNPDSEKRISEHKIGGFGILIVKKMMDEVIYERKDGANRLMIKKEL